MKENNFQPAEHSLEFNQVINHEGKVYLALELMVSKMIRPEDVLRPQISVDMIVKAYQVRLDRCMERMQWAIVNNRIVAIDGCDDSSHIYYESSEKVSDAAFKVEISSYSLVAAKMMKDAIAKLKTCVKSYVDRNWICENLSVLQIQQLIKAFEEILTAAPEVRARLVGNEDLLRVLNYLHECYCVVLWNNNMK